MFVAGEYDVIVIGAGHAGVEAALASARIGCSTLLATLSMDNIAMMPCNPSVGGPAKGHLVRELDALGGEMGINADKTCIQYRMLNTGKGPAVHALRAQADKKLYQFTMKETCEQQANLDVSFGPRPAVWVGIAGLGAAALRLVPMPKRRRAVRRGRRGTFPRTRWGDS